MVGSILSSSSSSSVDSLERCCGSEMLVLGLVGLVLPIVADDVGSQKVKRR